MGLAESFARAKAVASTTWTPEQVAFYEGVAKLPRGAALGLEARAGTGKTTSEVHAARFTEREGEANRVHFLAFGSKNAKELKGRLPRWVGSSTFHSLALRTVSPGKDPAFGKIWQYAKEYIKEYKLRNPAVTLAGLGKNLGIGLEGSAPDEFEVWEELVEEYGIRFQKRFRASDVARAGRDIFHRSLANRNAMDFDDLLYAFAEKPLGEGFTPLDWLFVDECQDVSPVQFLMIDRIRACGDGGCRLVFAGDPFQAIYGWRGAGVDSFEMMTARSNAQIFPLTYTHRCGVAIVQEAQRLVPDIKAMDGAHIGSVESVGLAQFSITDVAEGNAVVCRNNAPLFQLALEAFTLNKTVCVAGRDFGKRIIDVFQSMFERKAHPNDGFDAFRMAQDAVMRDYADKPFVKAILLDELGAASCVWRILARNGKRWANYTEFLQDAAGLLEKLLFDPDKDPAKGAVLTTAHRAKGLEWNEVFFYRPDLIPSKAAAALGGWHLAQETNLDYVARTRAKHRLVYVRGVEQEEEPDQDPNNGAEIDAIEDPLPW